MNTVLNKNLINPSKQPMFLGDPLGIQRYDKLKYPKFHELWKQQWEFQWMPDKVSLVKDRNDYEALTEVERFIFNSNVRWQTMTDSMLSRSIHEIKKYVSLTELEQCMGIWGAMEDVHSFSYTWIFKNVVKNYGKFFDSILEDQEIVKRANEISAAYDKLLGNPTDIKQQIFDAILNTQITEGLSFYTSFACSFFFAHRGKMEGSGKILQLIARDENLHVAITNNIMRNWRDNKEEGFSDIIKDNRQKVYDAYGLAVTNELKWAEYLFSKGSLLGLNYDILKGYIQWLANNRLVSLGYDRIFDVKTNPISGWFDGFLDSSKANPAPQEVEIISYTMNNSKLDVKDADYSDI